MAFTVRSELNEGYLHVFLEGDYESNLSMKAIQDVMNACVKHQSDKVLVDVRNLGGNMTAMDRFNIAQDFTAKYFKEKKAGRISHVRFAYLGNYPLIDPNRFGETVAVNRGLTMKASTELKGALDWLLMVS